MTARVSTSNLYRKGGKPIAVTKLRGSFGLDNTVVRDCITVNLPVPPSLNNIFVTAGNRRVRSQDYNAWLAEAGWRLQAQKPGRVVGPFSADLELPAGTRGDISNRYKVAADLLVKHGVTDDDRHEQDVRIRRSAEVTEARITIRSVERVAA